MTVGELVLADPESLRDLGSYAARAKTVDADGSMRLQATGRTLAAYVGVVSGRGLLGEGTVLGLRTAALAEPAEVDLTVPLTAVTDRTSRADSNSVLTLPPVGANPAWAALAAPRTGWELVGDVTPDQVSTVARQGIEAVTRGAPEGSGAAAVATIRHSVWSTMTDTAPALPAGLAFAAYALGFVVEGQPMRLYAHGRWTRLSSPAGHALAR